MTTGPLTPPASSPTALIAEDEPLLAQALAAELATAWPELRIVATVGDGLSAVQRALELRPQVLFFDIRMPGQDGLDAAAQLADEWPPELALPALVFVTAYDQYAIQAFERAAVDYLLKPVQTQRLVQTVQRVRQRLDAHPQAQSAVEPELMARLRALLASGHAATMSPGASGGAVAPLRSIQVSAQVNAQGSAGNTIRMIPVSEVLCFEAADKYVRVLTAQQEHLIRTPLKDLCAQLDPQQFWQIHRSVLVRADAIDTVSRDEAGRQWVALRGLAQRLPVSRLYAHLFRAM